MKCVIKGQKYRVYYIYKSKTGGSYPSLVMNTQPQRSTHWNKTHFPEAVVQTHKCNMKPDTIITPYRISTKKKQRQKNTITLKKNALVWLIKSDYVSLTMASLGQIIHPQNIFSLSDTHLLYMPTYIFMMDGTRLLSFYLVADWPLTHDSYFIVSFWFLAVVFNYVGPCGCIWH